MMHILRVARNQLGANRLVVGHGHGCLDGKVKLFGDVHVRYIPPVVREVSYQLVCRYMNWSTDTTQDQRGDVVRHVIFW